MTGRVGRNPDTVEATPPSVADAMVYHPKTFGPTATLHDVLAFFEDDHVHMALVVAGDGRLVTTIVRSDLPDGAARSTPATELGTLSGRTVESDCPLDAATARLKREKRRRLAVVDRAGVLLGLLCLTRHGNSYCSDDGIRARAQERERSRVSRG
jgi:CBS-domain-containing membrane protein